MQRMNADGGDRRHAWALLMVVIGAALVAGCVPRQEPAAPRAGSPALAPVPAPAPVPVSAPVPEIPVAAGETVLITDRIIQLHVVDGRAIYGKPGQSAPDRLEVAPLDLAKAGEPQTYTVSSTDDAAYAQPVHPTKVGRKSKGREFISGAKPDHVMEHWLYLMLPQPLLAGKTYTVDVGKLVTNGWPRQFVMDVARIRADTIKVNQVGYVPAAPKKFAYLSAWMGDLGGANLDAYAATEFRILDARTRQPVFTGKPALRKRYDQTPQSWDSAYGEDQGEGNQARADVWECDFSAFKTPGEYVLAVDRMGCSYPFRVADDIYRKPFIEAARVMYYQRCGTELKAPFSAYHRDACHTPEKLGPLPVSSHRYMDKAFGDGNGNPPLTQETREGIWGGWHDAGDWDQEGWHLTTAAYPLMVYELAPQKFKDGELNIPESGNGVPDILDQIEWCVDYYRRLQRSSGAVPVGRFASSFPKGREDAPSDTLKWFVYADEPEATYNYAALAARFARCLRVAGKPEGADAYVASARQAWAWANANDQDVRANWKVFGARLHAAAALFRTTGEARFQDIVKAEQPLNKWWAQDGLMVWGKRDIVMAAWEVATTDRPDVDAELKQRMIVATLNWADDQSVQTAEKRANRRSGNQNAPIMFSYLTRVDTLPLIVAYCVSKDPKYLWPQYTTADSVFGANPLNLSWMVGIGADYPSQVFHPDSWYGQDGQAIPGMVVEGPSRYAGEAAGNSGPWDYRYVYGTFYPAAKTWPVAELWSDNRMCPTCNEFEMGLVNINAAGLGFLCNDL